MNADRWKQIDELFHQALQMEERERSGFVRRTAAGDLELTDEVLSLLRAGIGDGSFLESPIHGGVMKMIRDDADRDPEPATLVGQRLGAYRLLALVAVGGMGAVFRAVRDDDEYRKEVAVKLVRRSVAGSSTGWRDDLRRRFQLERQVLANLEHPYIARLIDGGTSPDGRPFLVMEFVDGIPLDVYCLQNAPRLELRLRLFQQVCEAVQYAHQNLVIHRDLKPSNILVTADGTPKLLDFGLAKLIDPQRTRAADMATRTGGFMGTFAYSAPEQVSGGSGSHDTRSDVYALGLILYRMLTGGHAYDVEGPVSAVVRTITEVQPQAPSSRTRGIGSELDTIVLKALAKDQQRRYQSAGDLCADIQRHMSGEPIIARADSRWYILRKTARRYRVPLAMAAVILVMVSAFAVYAAIQSQRLAHRGAELARMLRESNIEQGRLLGMTGNLAGAESLLWPAHSSDPDSRSRWALWELYASQPCTHAWRFPNQPIAGAYLCDDGSRLVLDAIEGPQGIQIIDARDGHVLHSIVSNVAGGRMAMRQGGRLLLVHHPDGSVTVRDVHAPEQVRTILTGQPSAPRWMVVSPDESSYACATQSEVILRSTSDGRILRTIDHVTPAGLVAFSTDGRYLFEGTQTGVLQRIDLTDGSIIDVCEGTARGFAAVTTSPDGRYLALSTDFMVVSVIDLKSMEVATTIKEVGGWITSMAFHPSRNQPHLLAISSVDKVVRLAEIPSGRIVQRLTGHLTMAGVCFTASGDRLITAGRDGLVRFWELEPWQCEQRWGAYSETVFNMRVSPDGRTLALCHGQGTSVIRLLDARDGSEQAALEGHENVVSSLSFDPSGRVLVSASYDQTLRAWPLQGDTTTPRTIRSGLGLINAIAVSPDGKQCALATEGPAIVVVDMATGQDISREMVRAYRLPSLDWGSDGRWVAAAALDPGRIELLAPATGARRQIGSGFAARIVRFSPDASMLAAGGEDGTVRLWSMHGVESQDKQGEGHNALSDPPFRVLSAHQQDVFAMAFSPEGSALATGGRGGEIMLWDLASGQRMATLRSRGDMIFALAFSADGRVLFSAGRDGAVIRWDLEYYDHHIAGNAGAFAIRQDDGDAR